MKNFTGIILVVVLLAGMVTAVFAHDATIVKSIPANGEVLAESPPQVKTWFEEELVSGESTMRVFNTQGEQADNGDGGVDLNDPNHAIMIVTLPPLPDGSYTVQWHATLLDGDASDGAFAFAVGKGQSVIPAAVPNSAAAAESSSPSPVDIIAVVFVGLFVLLLIVSLVIRRRQA
ncbi:MAG: copper resistance protein CopC [Ardenticatenaceae bacterium]|nr:copper resistance protein CopC [Ardenticatenaceae bacterium]MCB9445214.1 copper resistance protein CopC [Ardenticatenaceae bacterium]